MTDQAIDPAAPRRTHAWRIAGWGLAAALILAPLVAMQLQVEGVNWTASDFVFAIVMFAVPGLLFEAAVRSSASWSYRGGVALALLTGFLTVWINLAVGIVGNEDNPVNLLFFGVVLIALVGALVARFRAAGMALAMFTAALVQLAIASIPWLRGLEDPIPASILSLVLAGLWLISGLLFRKGSAESVRRGDDHVPMILE